MTTHIMVRNCPGGHVCHTPKECCRQGCCYSPDYIPKTTTSPTTGSVLSPILLGHWYFWAAITATLAGIVCACSLWKRHSSNLICCRNSARDERASEPDSNGSCYNPPQYSRCNSFYQAPPPYSEVTSKPDLYPLVINCNEDGILKNNGTPTGYLMVQYFRNFLVRPVGSLSATTTIDSLNSSFICNATNEANTIIPPPYSCMGSLEEVNGTINNSITITTQLPISITCNELHLPRSSSSIHSHISTTNVQSSYSQATSTNTTYNQTIQQAQDLQKKQTACLIRSTPSSAAKLESTDEAEAKFSSITNQKPGEVNCDGFQASTQVHIVNKKLNLHVLTKERSVDSESQDDDHNFSDLLNLSVCLPSSVIHLPNGMQSHAMQDLQQSYSVTNSMTSSDISSLANLGTPDSPPRATSPTVEMKELLDKIQQLPQQRSPLLDIYHRYNQQPQHQHVKVKTCFNKSKVRNLYMPLQNGPNTNQVKVTPKMTSSVTGIFGKNSRCWLSRSAPNTPCSNFVPSFSVQKRTTTSQRSSKVKLNDVSPLLHNHDESDEDLHKDECL
ncbi:hypothetical protein Trydic_g17545 [Trypoxylus dichotomus]